MYLLINLMTTAMTLLSSIFVIYVHYNHFKSPPPHIIKLVFLDVLRKILFYQAKTQVDSLIQQNKKKPTVEHITVSEAEKFDIRNLKNSKSDKPSENTDSEHVGDIRREWLLTSTIIERIFLVIWVINNIIASVILIFVSSKHQHW